MAPIGAVHQCGDARAPLGRDPIHFQGGHRHGVVRAALRNVGRSERVFVPVRHHSLQPRRPSGTDRVISRWSGRHRPHCCCGGIGCHRPPPPTALSGPIGRRRAHVGGASSSGFTLSRLTRSPTPCRRSVVGVRLTELRDRRHIPVSGFLAALCRSYPRFRLGPWAQPNPLRRSHDPSRAVEGQP